MIKPLLSAIALTVTLMPAVSVAGPATDALASCVADNTTGKDRKDLAKWVFVAMSAHPEIKPLSKASDAVKESLDKNLANIATKLITESCRTEAHLAVLGCAPLIDPHGRGAVLFDIGGGSYFIEKLTHEFGQAAWRIFQDIERKIGRAHV